MNILDLLQQNPAVKALSERKDCFAALTPIEEAILIASSFRRKKQNIIVVKNNLYNAQKLYDLLRELVEEKELILFATEESLRIEAIATSPEMAASKMDALYRLQTKEPKILITHGAGFVHYLPSKEYFAESTISLSVGKTVTIEELSRKLHQAGYEEVSRVDQPLTFAKRGGIVDVYSMNYNQPLRIEFFDTEIDSIRFFDLSSQRTIETVNEVSIIPATDLLLKDIEIKEIRDTVLLRLENQKQILEEDRYLELEENILKDLDYLENRVRENYLYRYFGFLNHRHTIGEYMENPLVVLSTEEDITNTLHNVLEENVSYIQELYGDNKALLAFNIQEELATVCYKKDVIRVRPFVSDDKTIQSGIYTVNSPKLALSFVVRELATVSKEKKVVLWLVDNELKMMAEELLHQNIPYQIIGMDGDIPEGISLCFKSFSEGFECYRENVIVYTSKEIFNKQHKIGRYANKFKEAEVLSSYLDLQPKDYVVHNLYGIGQYLGIVTKEINQMHKDFLKIVYRGDDVLLVPLEQFQLVRKFVSREGVTPKLNKLGSNEWKKTKENLQNNVNDLAERLVALYSQRDQKIGYAFAPDNEEQIEFEKTFAYQLTPDQKTAIEEVKKDMMSSKPMDRLLCGDVGFGKTEVAIRAAFKAVLENKQVAFLCPTTILSHQHYDTFKERLKNYPIRVAMLNRFVSESEQKSIIEDLKKGYIDILIGTHRILSKDVKYNDLGLLIIDEEQRFGVEHKEKIKEIKQSIDVLSLSATPIPRTLQMSLIGIRSLSQLNTPPNNRMPVLTYVIERNQSVIKEVIQRELVRGGQVFYLYNNVAEIYNVANRLKIDLPDAKIAVAHGQMNREDIEDVMYRFVNNDYNVLICTTIIETGIDIPNANTILIDNADRFGLSQLYQIKGRVGRSDRLAYAYLMYSPQKQLTEIAQKRLTSIKEFTELGSGYKIAMRDLTIRGAGDLLGPKQSGFIDTVGIDMYIEMLNEAISTKKGEVKEVKEERQSIPMELDAYIPEQFTNQDYEKITLYQRIDKATKAKQLNDLEEEITDQYGKLPASVALLFDKKRLEILLKEPEIQSFKEGKKEIEIVFTNEWSSKVDGIKLFETVSRISAEIDLRYLHGNIILKLRDKKNWMKIALELLNATKGMVNLDENR